MSPVVTARPLAPLPEIGPGADLAALLVEANDGEAFSPGEVVVVSHKVVSKAEGQVVELAAITPSDRAVQLTAELGKEDPRLVQVIVDQSTELIRAERGVLICRTRHGFVCANAGVDSSNAGGADRCVLLPKDSDASARALRNSLRGKPAIVVADSFGRAWRNGECDIAIGVAGLLALQDRRGADDRDGRELRVSGIAIADQAAAAADLARGDKASGVPAVAISGLNRYVTSEDGPGVAALLRPRDEDLFGAEG